MTNFQKPVVTLSSSDVNNSSLVMDSVIQALRQNKVSESLISDFKFDTMTGDHENLLNVSRQYVDLLVG